MSRIAAATVAGFNDFLREQRGTDGTALLSLTKFQSSGIRTPYVDLDVHRTPDMTSIMFNPSSMTNLRDAILQRIADLGMRLSRWDIVPRVLFVVMTDGADNASQTAPEATRQAIESASELGWTFVFLGANQNALEVGASLGFQPGNCRSFAASEMRETMTVVASATTAFRSTDASVRSAFFAQ